MTMLRKTGVMKMTMMNGKSSKTFFEDLFTQQMVNQEMLINKGTYGPMNNVSLPSDNVNLMSYHVQQLISEIGEILDADKRWKNFRNEKHDQKNKEEEIADCFIVLMNIAMYSGMSGYDLSAAIKEKLDKVSSRISEI